MYVVILCRPFLKLPTFILWCCLLACNDLLLFPGFSSMLDHFSYLLNMLPGLFYLLLVVVPIHHILSCVFSLFPVSYSFFLLHILYVSFFLRLFSPCFVYFLLFQGLLLGYICFFSIMLYDFGDCISIPVWFYFYLGLFGNPKLWQIISFGVFIGKSTLCDTPWNFCCYPYHTITCYSYFFFILYS